MANSPYPSDPVLTAVAIAYRNQSLIADQVCPRIPPLMQREFRYTKYALEQGFTVPDTRVGRKSAVNQIEFTGTKQTASCADYGLRDQIPQDDINNANPQFDPRSRSVEQIANIIALGREVRVATLLGTAANYGAANKVTVGAGDYWDDRANSTPLDALLEYLDAPVMRPNVVTFGEVEWRHFRSHPQIVSAVQANSGEKGAASRQQVAELLEVAEVNVGRARINAASKGQAQDIQRCWGGFVVLQYLDRLADNRSGTTHAFTGQYGGPEGWQRPLQRGEFGLKGGVEVGAGESVKELITAPDLGFLIVSPITPA